MRGKKNDRRDCKMVMFQRCGTAIRRHDSDDDGFVRKEE